jgi:hypothetical protein
VLHYDEHTRRQLCRERVAQLTAAARRTRIPTRPDADGSGNATTLASPVACLLHQLRGDEPDREPAYRAP